MKMKVIVALSVLALLLIAGCSSYVARPDVSTAPRALASGQAGGDVASTAELPSHIGEDVSGLDTLDQDLNVDDIDVKVDDFESIDF